ncbi:hypothetical protein ACH5RR_007353 [Cinchona calisaya]|uniref:Myb-like domain-containing protein n=1 Tax=Cinchona calisaya TaxID=153742 RepID=A0ABD3AS20_9GENT
MASKVSLPPTLPWSWVIEALSSSNQLDTSVLIDMVKNASEIADDLGKNSKEMVSLGILESLTVKGNRSIDIATPAEGQKNELDPSNHCEDVLRHILEEMSATDRNVVAPMMLNWDIQSFILHKRASLPICALQKLKDAILEGSHSVFASLKERSGLAVRTQCDDNIPVNGGNCSGIEQRLEESSRSIKFTMPNRNLSSPTPQNMVDKLQENLPDRNLLPAKKDTAATTSENLVIQTYENQTTLDDGCVPHAEDPEKYKQDANFTGGTAVENSIASPKHGLLTDTSVGVVGCIEKEGCNLEKEVQVGSSIPQRNDDGFVENLPNKNLLPAKRNRAATSAENLERETCKDRPLSDGCDPYAVAAKKLKQDAISTVDNLVEDSMVSPVHGLMTISSEGTVEHIEREGSNLEKAVQVGGMESNVCPHNGDNQHAASKRLAQSSDAFHRDHLLSPPQVPVDDTIVAELSTELHGRNNDVGKANGHSASFEQRTSNATSSDVGIIEKMSSLENPVHNFQGNFQQNSSGGGEAKDDYEHNPDYNMTSDSDEYHDERIDIASKKDAFLSSQCTYSQDSFATQAKYCVKCNKDGQLLVCSSDTCQLVVHESCLSSAASFDGNGKFYCPFCSYSQAISNYMQAKKKASFARKDLATFIGLKVERRPKKLSMRSRRAKENQLRENDDLCANNEGNMDEDCVNKISNSHCKDNVEQQHQAEPSISSSGDYPLCGEKVVDVTDTAPHMLVKGNLERQDAGQECQSPRGQVEQQIAAHSVHKSDSDCTEPDAINRKERRARAKAQTRGMKNSEIPEAALSHQPDGEPITESSEENNEKPATKYSIRSRKPMKQYSTYPAIPQLRRKPLPWTKVEEEKLKEGVQRLASDQHRSIPWKEILEFGGDVFQRGRTTVDLKDKWRNVCKGSPTSK